MDYSRQPLIFRAKKALRYVRLYGLPRTLAKIRAQQHMRRTYDPLPAITPHRSGDRHVAIIGCGTFAFGNIAYYLTKNYGHVIRAAMDIDVNRAASLFASYDLTYYTDNADRILADPSVDLIFIASNHASHADYAVRALELNKSVHIEKPHVVSADQLERLCEAMGTSAGAVNLGFNRPTSRIGREIKHALASQSGPAMYNWFIAGHEIPKDHWYFQEAEGGRVLGNLCHWTDFVYQMVDPGDRYPIQIRPTLAAPSDSDIAVNFIFGDGSIAAITFSAKGHAFEGVRERFAAQRGDILVGMSDFKSAVIERVEHRRVISSMFRDHGHESAIKRSYEMVRPKPHRARAVPGGGCSINYVWETGQLFLKTKEALEHDRAITVMGYAGAPARSASLS